MMMKRSASYRVMALGCTLGIALSCALSVMFWGSLAEGKLSGFIFTGCALLFELCKLCTVPMAFRLRGRWRWAVPILTLYLFLAVVSVAGSVGGFAYTFHQNQIASARGTDSYQNLSQQIADERAVLARELALFAFSGPVTLQKQVENTSTISTSYVFSNENTTVLDCSPPVLEREQPRSRPRTPTKNTETPVKNSTVGIADEFTRQVYENLLGGRYECRIRQIMTEEKIGHSRAKKVITELVSLGLVSEHETGYQLTTHH